MAEGRSLLGCLVRYLLAWLDFLIEMIQSSIWFIDRLIDGMVGWLVGWFFCLCWSQGVLVLMNIPRLRWHRCGLPHGFDPWPSPHGRSKCCIGLLQFPTSIEMDVRPIQIQQFLAGSGLCWDSEAQHFAMIRHFCCCGWSVRSFRVYAYLQEFFRGGRPFLSPTVRTGDSDTSWVYSPTYRDRLFSFLALVIITEI